MDKSTNNNEHNFTAFKFKPASGTTNQGQEYEEKVTAYLALKIYQKTTIEDYWISSNMEGMAPLDDVIVCTREGGKNRAYFFQIKHSKNSKWIAGNELNAQKGKLSMHVFCKEMDSIKSRINQCIPKDYQPLNKIKVIVFTTRPVYVKDIATVFILKDNNQFSTEGGKVYRLNPESFSKKEDSHFCNFLKSVYIYANQANISKLEQNIKDCMKEILGVSSIHENSLSNYMKYIQNWIQITEEKIGFTHEFIRKLLEFSFLLGHALELDISQETINKIPGDYLWEDIKNKSLYITKAHLPFIIQMISNSLHQFNMQEAGIEIGNVLFKNYDFAKLTSNQKYILSRFLGLSPFIIEKDQFPNLSRFQFKYIPIGTDDNYNNLDQISDDTLLQLLDEPITLSCGRKIILGDTIKDSRECLLPKLTISSALSLVCGENNVHNNNDEIIFPRNIKPIILRIDVLGISSVTNDLFVLNVSNFNKQRVLAMMNVNEKYVCNLSNYEDKFKYVLITDDFEFQNFITKFNLVLRNVHCVKLISMNSNLIKWLGTYGSVNHIKGFRVDLPNKKYAHIENNNLIHLTNIHTYFQQTFLVISGVPGIGKSTAMKQIIHSAPVDMWVLPVDLKTEQNYFKTLNDDLNKLRDSITCLKHFYKNDCLFLKEIYNIKLKNKEVLILFDGFDEIAPTCTEIVSEIITRIREDGFKIILSTRTVLEKQMEDTFGTFAVSLCAFTDGEQEAYLKKYFLLNGNTDVINTVNRRSILDRINSQNSFQFCSIPLHINLIANILLKDLDNVVNGDINLLNIYQQYTQHKIEIFEKKFKYVTDRENIEDCHKYFGIKTLFSHTKHYALVDDNIDCYLMSFMKSLKIGGEKIGLLISDDQIFVHRTIAEYYVAKWLVDIIIHKKTNALLPNEEEFGSEILKSEILKNEFSTLRLFFNLIINKDCKLHEAIIFEKYAYVKEIIENNVKEIHKLNKYNQTLLHTIISSCNLDEKSYNLNQELVEILRLIYTNCTEILTSNDFFNLTPFEYAKIRVSKFSLQISVIEIQIEDSSSYFFSYNQPFNLIDFLFAKLKKGITILDILSIMPNVKEINFDSLSSLANSGHFSEVRDLLKTSEGLDAVDENGNNLIHWAVENNNKSFINVLLSDYKYFSKLFTARNNNGDTPLLIAVQFGNLNIIKELVTKLPTLNTADQDVAIIYAVIGKNFPIVEYLLNSNYKYLNPVPIFIAFKQGKIRTLEYLLKIYIKPEPKVTIFHYASTYKNKFIIVSVMKLCKRRNTVPLINISTEYKKWLQQSVHLNSQDNYKQPPLMYAIKNDNKNVTHYLIRKGAKTNYTDKDGLTYLHHAVQSESLETLNYLCVKKYININSTSKSGLTSLHLSVQNNNFEIAQLLINCNADINCVDNLGWSCLHFATENANEDLINLLCQNGAHIDVKDNDGRTCLDISILIENLPIMKLLIKNGSNPKSTDDSGFTCLHHAIHVRDHNIIKYLIEFYDDLNVKNRLGRTPLHLTAEFGKLEVSKFLVTKGADVKCLDNDGDTCLHNASIGGHINLIEYFMQWYNVDVKNSLGRTPLHYTAQFGKLEASKFLFGKKADVKCLDNDGGTCLHHASRGGHINSIAYFMQWDKVEVKNSLGMTPLHYAAQFGTIEASKFLVRKGADVKCLDIDEATCLDHACIGGHINLIEYFMQLDNVEVKNSLGMTLLHITALHGKLEASKFLVTKGADVKCLDNNGDTCLHHASIGGHINLIEYFMQWYNVDVKNSLGRTPLHYTAQFGKLEASKFLVSKGADVNCLDDDGDTCLHYASIEGHINSIEYFMQYHNVDMKNSFDETPLQKTAKFGQLEASKFLVSKGADVKCLDNDGDTCLHSASIGGHINSIEYFMQYHNVDMKNSFDETPLQKTAKFGQLEASKFLVSKGADVKCLDNDGDTCLHSASIGGHINSIEYFMQYHNVDVENCFDETPLHKSAEFGKLEASKFLVSNGADVKCLDNDGDTCLHHASIGGHINLIEYFMQWYNVDVKNSLGRTPLHLTAQFGKLKASKFLVSKGAHVKCLDNDEVTCLHHASIGGHINLIEYFLQWYNVDVKNSSGLTPLHSAAQFGKLEASNFLVSKGADVKYLDNNETTCLHHASFGGNINLIEYFMQWYNVDVKNSFGLTPLHITAQQGQLEASKFLVTKGADVQCLDNNGDTCLHHASIGGHINLIEYFMQYHNVDVENCFDETPLHKTAEFGKLEASKFLISNGADVKCLDNDGNTCLHHASIEGHINSIVYFMQYYNVNIKNRFVETPLDLAIKNEHSEVIDILSAI